MQKEKKKRGLVISEKNLNSKKTTYGIKRIELKNKNLQILQRRRNVRFMRKSHSFFPFFMKRTYIDIFLYIICIPRRNTQLFLESTKKKWKKLIYTNEANAERTDKTNQNIISFISIIHKYLNTQNINSQNSCDISFLSQAYVFLKLLQTRIINIYKLRSVFEYHENFFFLKNEIKDSFFGVQGIFDSKLNHKNFPNSVINQWTNWLKDHYQYDLSQNRWSRLVPQKWKNKITERRVAQNKDLTEYNSYEKKKNRLILYKEQQVGALKKKKIRKQYRYDLLSYYFINYTDKKNSYIYGYKSLFQANKAIYSNYNAHKKEFFDIIGNSFITNYIAEDTVIDMEKNQDRKHFDWPGINIEILNRSISNPDWFFSKFVRFYNAYRDNPWIIPIKLLFLHFNVNQNLSENKDKITRKKKIIDIYGPSKKKKSLELELETQNRAKALYADQINLEIPLSNQEKYFVGSGNEKNIKGIKKKKDKTKMEVKLNFLLRNFLILHLNWKNFLGQRIFKNVKVYCLLIRFKKLREITIASIQRGELGIDIMMIQNQKNFILPSLRKKKKFMKKDIFVIEPVRLSKKNNKQFLMYQTVGLSLIHKNKRTTYQKYPEKSNVNKKNVDKYITRTRDQKVTEKKNFDLLVPETILSARRRRELRILICLNPSNINSIHRKTLFYNENKVQNCFQVLTKNYIYLEKEKKKLMNFKIFLWPNYRLEDLACINRYWFYTHNGSRFSIVRIHMYPRLKIR